MSGSPPRTHVLLLVSCRTGPFRARATKPADVGGRSPGPSAPRLQRTPAGVGRPVVRSATIGLGSRYSPGWTTRDGTGGPETAPPAAHAMEDQRRKNDVTTTLSNKARALVERAVIANVATVDSEGRPQLTPLWIDLEGNDLVFNTARVRAKYANLDKRPYVAVSVVDPRSEEHTSELQSLRH